jgi:hypothetical protein
VINIGQNMKGLRVLWLNQCELKDLSYFGRLFPKLEEFYVCFNYIEEVKEEVSLHKNLKVLDLEGNMVKDSFSLVGLNKFVKLEELNLSDNPICSDNKDMNMVIKFLREKLKNLKMLNEKPFKSFKLKRGNKKGSKRLKSQRMKEDFKDSANLFIKKLQRSKLGQIVEDGVKELEIDELIDSLAKNEEEMKDLDDEELLMKNVRASSILNYKQIDSGNFDIDRELGLPGKRNKKRKHYAGNPLKMIKERRKECFVEEEDQIDEFLKEEAEKLKRRMVKQKGIEDIMDNFGHKQTRQKLNKHYVEKDRRILRKQIKLLEENMISSEVETRQGRNGRTRLGKVSRYPSVSKVKKMTKVPKIKTKKRIRGKSHANVRRKY